MIPADGAKGSVILFEDIDCMKAADRRPDRQSASHHNPMSSEDPFYGKSGPGVTLSGLLNVLDGFHAPENVVFVMTTNDIDALDPALLRPGRIDYRLFLGEAALSQKLELYRRFFPKASEAEAERFAYAEGNETMAEFQGRLLHLEEHSSQPLLRTGPGPPPLTLDREPDQLSCQPDSLKLQATLSR